MASSLRPDGFEGLSLMDSIMAVKRGDEGARSFLSDGERRFVPVPPSRLTRSTYRAVQPSQTSNPLPNAAVLGRPNREGGAPRRLHQNYLDERALFRGRWGLTPSRKGGRPSYDELVETEGGPGCAHCSIACRPRTCSKLPSSTATTRLG